MEKISKTVPQKEVASSSRSVGDGTAVEHHLEEFVLTKCPTVVDFKTEKTSSVPGRCEPVSRYICTITDNLLTQVKEDCNWVDKHMVVPLPEDSITTNVEVVAQVSDVVLELKEWSEGLVLQRTYSEHAWMELSKGRLEARNHGLGKDMEMRPPSSDEEILPQPSVPKPMKEKNRKGAPSSSNSEGQNPKKRQSQNPKASVLHHETFLRYREEVIHHEAKIREIQAQVDAIQAEAEEFKKNMDIFGSKKKVVQAQLESAKIQLRAAKEKASEQVKKIQALQSKLDMEISNKASLVDELEVTRSEAVVAITKADAKVAHYKVDIEAIQVHAKSMVDHARWKVLREDLEDVRAQGFDILAEIENAKIEETRAQKLSFPEEDSESLSEFEGGEDSEVKYAASNKDFAT
ncbi:uncharacterized protein [Nicotiana sylvestris]|uniref:uncharacterized protein n=1 Tax=Nicotiana sylvestris TaxID=4096 RepID=UPI00388C8420